MPGALGYQRASNFIQKGLPVLFATLFDIISILFSAIQGLLVIYMILSFLFAFNVINGSNHFLMSAYQGIDSLLNPILNPLRRLLPQTRGMDFSPLALIVLMQIVMSVLARYQQYYL